MSKEIINLEDRYSYLKEKVTIGSNRPRGEVSIFEKTKSGKLVPIIGKQNMIVFSGRNWLLRRAFGPALTNNVEEMYKKVIKWFAVGNGGGEPGNPLQAGATYGSDTALYSPVRFRSDMVNTDPGYEMYASDYEGNHGYYKTFSSVTIREDRGNPYTVGNVTTYPPLIAEVRIELSSDDADGGSYEDLNEAALFLADPDIVDPGSETPSGGEIGTSNIVKVVTDVDYGIYYLDTYDLNTDLSPNILHIGDYLYVINSYNPSDPNCIPSTGQALIVDMFNGEAGVRKAYIVVEKPGAVDEDYTVGVDNPVAHFVNQTITPYIMFSRVTFSTIRKTVDREIVFLWKIYF